MAIKYYKVSRLFKFLLYILFIFSGIEDREAALMMIINKKNPHLLANCK